MMRSCCCLHVEGVKTDTLEARLSTFMFTSIYFVGHFRFIIIQDVWSRGESFGWIKKWYLAEKAKVSNLYRVRITPNITRLIMVSIFDIAVTWSLILLPQGKRRWIREGDGFCKTLWRCRVVGPAQGILLLKWRHLNEAKTHLRLE